MSSKKFGFTILAIAALGFAACAARPDIRVDRDPGTDLSTYKTFAFMEGTHPGARYTSLVASHLRAATMAEMQKRNYRYDPANPDLRIGLLLVVTNRTDLQSTTLGPFPARPWARDEVQTVRYKQGTLVIDLVDARRNALVWQGIADGRVDADALEQPAQAIDRVVGEIFARL